MSLTNQHIMHNNYITKVAKTYARATRCIYWPRRKLKGLLDNQDQP
jgi:hypothetical protein